MIRHPDLRPLLDEVPLPAPGRAELLAHVRACAECRVELASADPSRLFALLGSEPVPREALERLSQRVAAAIASEPRRRPAAHSWAWGALAASLLVAGMLGAYLLDRPGVEPPAPLPPQLVEREAARPFSGTALPAGMVEVLDSPGDAEVIEIPLGDVQVVMIFDTELPL